MAVLETQDLRLTFDDMGSLIEVYSKPSDWYLLNRAHLGLSFRMMLPLEGRRNNNVWGHKQKKPPSCRSSKDSVEFTWDTVESEYGGVHNIKVRSLCEIVGGRAIFRMNIDNGDSVMVENVYYPYFGDMHRPAGCTNYNFMAGDFGNLEHYSLFPTFPNMRGYYGVETPVIIPMAIRYGTPPMHPIGIFADNSDNGFYISVAENRMECLNWQIELHPGYENSADQRVPEADTIDGKDVSIRFGVTHIPYIAPGQTFDVLPFGIQAYCGNWNVAVQKHLQVSKQWTVLPSDLPEWAKEPHSWLQLHINSPEDELRVRYKDLPKYAEECARLGVKAIQLVGWNNGGQDRGNPYHDTDPRLGTWQELYDAIKEIQQMGVKVILFAKFTWADRSNEDFKSRWEPLAIKDPYGEYYLFEGYKYFTATQLNDINTRRLIPMCFACEEYIDICIEEFQKCVDLGADGILYDESQHHKPAMACFDPSHGHRYGEPMYAHDRKLIDRFREALNGKEFMLAGEAAYDDQMDYYHSTYVRTWQKNHYPIIRALRPKTAQIMTAVNGFNDRVMINRCLRDMYIISYEPYNFKGMLSDFPLTVDYGQKMEKLRTNLREYFWDGTYNGNLGASVTADGKLHDNYSVFKTDSGKTGLIICNDSADEAITVTPTLEDGGKLSFYCLIEQPERKPLTGPVTIPPLCAAAVI